VTRAVLALDQGSHASRACIYDQAGVLCAAHTLPVTTRHIDASHIEQDADELLRSLQSAAQAAVRTALQQRPQLQLVAAGLAVQRSTIVCCTRAGVPLGPALSWQDRRNDSWLQTLAPHESRIREITGLPLSAHYGASKLRWCLEHLPAVSTAAQRADLLAAPLASFLALRLGGGRDARIDPANAARTLLWDSRQLDWSEELLQLFALQRDWLPHCTHTHDDYGTLEIDGQRLPLRALTGDQSAMPFASGAADNDTLYVNLGTGAFIQRPLAARPPSPAPLLGSVLCSAAAGARYTLEGTVNGAGSAVSWFCASEKLDEAALWEALETLAATAPLPVFLNGVGGLGSPWWRAQFTPQFIGTGTALERFAAIIESIAFMIASNAQLLARQAGPARALVLAGGMSRSGWLCRKLAVLLQLPIGVLESEASARGVAALAAPAWATHWSAGMARIHEPAAEPTLLARYQLFQECLNTALQNSAR
jgi:glycerol kinase